MNYQNYHKLLIANRGEIACRVIRSAHDMGISCVAVYVESDADSLFVKMADEAIKLIPPRDMSLERALEWIEDDELLEVTPKSVRIRKKYLTESERKRHSRK